MPTDAEYIAHCRITVLKVLATEMTPESHRAEFEEDIVYFAVRTMEDHDPVWLLAEARDRRHPLEGRRNLVSCMGRFQAELGRELRKEAPDLPRLWRE